MKNFELIEGDDNGCTIIERSTGTSITNTAPLPASKERVIALMCRMLKNPDSTQEHDDEISVFRTRDELRLVVGLTQVPIKWPNVFPIVLEDS